MVRLVPAETLAPAATPTSTPNQVGLDAPHLQSAIIGDAFGRASASRTRMRPGDAFTSIRFERSYDSAPNESRIGSKVVYDPTYKLHDAATFSSLSRRGGRSASYRSTRRSRSAMGPRTLSTTRLLDGSIHTVDAGCCGYRDVAAHEAHHRKVKGLFVTFCQGSLETQLANATRELECETALRQGEQETYRQKLGGLLRENDQLRRENAELQAKVADWDRATAEKVKDMQVLKEEYERRWREETEHAADLRRTTSAAVEEAERLRTEVGARRFHEQELNDEMKVLRDVLTRAENQSRESAKRAQMMFEEKETIRHRSEDQAKYQSALLEQLAAKEAIITGLQSELSRAQDKLSSIAFFKESFGSPRGKARSSLRSGSDPAHDVQHAAVKDRLYKRYFGRMA